MFALFTIVALLLMAIAAPRWGADSSDGIDSTEWECRRSWRGFR